MPLVPTINSLRVLSSACTQNFNVRYSLTGQVLALFNYLYNPWHPLQRKLSAKYSRQEKEFVLVVNTTKKSVSGKSCVRTTVARRIRELVLTELRTQGWSRNGTPLGPKDSRGIGTTVDGVRRYPLTGCLAFFPFEESLTVPIAQLRSEVRRGVEVFVEHHENARIDALERQLRELQQQESPQAGPAVYSNEHSHSPRHYYQAGGGQRHHHGGHGHDLKEPPDLGYDGPRHNHYQSDQLQPGYGHSRGRGRGRGRGYGGRGYGGHGDGSRGGGRSGPGPPEPADHNPRNQNQQYQGRGHDRSPQDNRRQPYPYHPHPHSQAAPHGHGQVLPGEQKRKTGAVGGGSLSKSGPPPSPSVRGGGGSSRK